MEPSANHSRNTSAMITMLVLALLVVVIPFSSNVATKTKRKPPLILRTEEELALLRGDRDGNQAADWKELILGSMSTTTKEKAKGAPTDPSTLERLNNPNNLTSSFSKNIYTASAFVASNPNINEEEQANLIANLVEKEASKIQPKVYTLDELTLTRVDTNSEKRSYGNALALLLKKADDYKLMSDDLTPLMKYNETKDEQNLLFFNKKRDDVQKILTELVATPVPSSAAIFHLNLINAVSVFALELDAFANTKSDPIKSLAFVNSYKETSLATFRAILVIKNYFNVEKVPFTSNDPGVMFINKK